MSGDLHYNERVVLDENVGTISGAIPNPPIHQYGRVRIVASPLGAPAPELAREVAPEASPPGLDPVEELGLSAFRLRESAAYQESKTHRVRDGEPWDMPGCLDVPPGTTRPERAPGSAPAAAPTSTYLEGTVAVGIVIVQGPTAALRFTDAEVLNVVAEVQNGLGYFALANPVAGISFAYDIQNVTLSVPADPAADDLEGRWRDPAMAAIGYAPDWSGVEAYVEDLRTRLGTRWTFCGFFTKYPLWHFAYASIGGPRVVMDYNNDGWGPGNIDRVFAHETGHIFNAPDEYAGSGCDCSGAWGRYGLENHNCENCASFGGVDCLMKGNTFDVCGYTPGHIGWSPQLLVRSFGANAVGWRVDRHPRLLADTSGDGRADVVGFGDAGVYVSRAQSDGRLAAPHLAVPDFGYGSGWRVDRHPRFVLDTTGDGRADIVGFSDAGVYVSRAQADGTFGPVQLVLPHFGYVAGGWRVENHPRFMVDLTGDGRADVVGFGHGGVYVSLARADGTYGPVQLAVAAFGYNDGWRVQDHPRMLADTTGDGRPDIVGFGHRGVWVSRNLGGGTFEAPGLVIPSFGYATGWRVERHPRFVADVTGGGRADIVGFGDAGVYVFRDGTPQTPPV